MAIFTSRREKRLWLWVQLTVIGIYSTLFVGRPFAEILGDQNMQTLLFFLAMGLIGITVIAYALGPKKGRIEFVILLGIAAVYLLFFIRLGLPERSHLMEYTVLTVFIHSALTERLGDGKSKIQIALLTLLLALAIGTFDELVQKFLPERVFDPIDILFNSLAITLALISILILNFVKGLIRKE